MKYLFSALLLMCTLQAEEIIQCPNCHDTLIIKTEAKRMIWGHTWTCPNPTCGYDNYEGIDYCGICGTKRP